MKDRQPTQPGRVKLTPENGTSPFYAIMEMADEPTEIGTPPTKAYLLQDETEFALFGNVANRTVNNAFMGVATELRVLRLLIAETASVTVTVKSTGGTPLSNVQVLGMFDESGVTCVTNASGVATGYVNSGSVTLQINGYADIVDYSETFTATAGETYNKQLNVTVRNFLAVTSSRSIKFSDNTDFIDVSVVGAGAGGSSGWASSRGSGAASGHGGCGGYITTRNNVSITANVSYPIIVGAGGTGGKYVGSTNTEPTSGGNSSAFGLTANGATAGTNSKMGSSQYDAAVGTFGSGNGLGGRGIVASYSSGRNTGNAGGNSSAIAYISFTETATLGAGGGSGAADTDTSPISSGGAGGSVGGGIGGGASRSGGVSTGKNGTNAEANTGSGGGGGCAYSGATSDGQESGQGNGGNGAAGMVGIRIHLKSA